MSLPIIFVLGYFADTNHTGQLIFFQNSFDRVVDWSLYQQGKECWMIGNSVSDITFAPALCKLGVVGNSSPWVKQTADLVAEDSYTKGVLELIQFIPLNNPKCRIALGSQDAAYIAKEILRQFGMKI